MMMVVELLEKFEDIFQPAEKDELVTKRGWALLSQARSEVELLSSEEEVQKYSQLSSGTFKSLYRQGINFYGVVDKESGDRFLVTASLSRHITVYDAKGDVVKYFME